MNGRLCDPVLGRFLNADPVIQFPGFAQSYNSYSYVMNNPLRFTDPTGYTASMDAFTEAGLDNRSLDELQLELYGEIYFDITLDSDLASIVLFNGKRSDLKLHEDGTWTLKGHIISKEEAMVVLHEIARREASSMIGNPPRGSAVAKVAPIALTAAAIDGPIIPIGDVLGGVVLAGAAAYDATQRVYITYTLTNGNSTYVGRASGYGTPYQIMMRRYSGHHMRAFGYSNPVLDRAIQGVQGYPAIRGREQQMIDFFGGAGSPNVGNIYRGVSKLDVVGGRLYHGMSNLYFGPLAPYTGY